MSLRRRGGLLLLGAGAIFTAAPALLIQAANLGLLRSGAPGSRAVALTFDDGPDPRTTPAVLDALQRAGVQATFFVLAGNAEAHPDLIARLLASGHEVQAHAVTHRHAWLRSPWGAYRDPGAAARRIRAVTGTSVSLHRPPHGAYTWPVWLGQRAAGLTGAHWSVEGRDWHPRATPAQVRARLLARLRPGAVIVLHDAGPGARVTTALLPDLLSDLGARGYALHTLSTLPGLRTVTPADVARRLLQVFRTRPPDAA